MKTFFSLALIMIIQLCSIGQSIPSYIPQNGLVGYWPFNGNANDESGNGNNGTVNGATLTNDRFGNSNEAYDFDSDYISVSGFNLELTTNYTVSFWAQPIIYDDGYTVAFELNQGTACNSNPICGFYSNNLLYSTCGGPGESLNMGSFSSLQNLWTHFVVISSGSNSFVYKNGVFLTSNTINWPQINLNRLTIGNNGNSASPMFGQPFKGGLDDFGIWNRVLTQQEITALYTGCNLNATINPSLLTGTLQENVQFSGNSNSGSIQWQSNPNNVGWTNLPSNETYSGQNTSTLQISNLELSNHNQPFRIVVSDGDCIDTSDVAYVQILDTCVTNVTVYDTTYVSVEDTLIINSTITSIDPIQVNTFKVYPNPANDQLTIENGNISILGGYSISIQNHLGQVVFNQDIDQPTFTIDLSTWTGDGLYHLNIIDSTGNIIDHKKIVIQ